MIGIIYTRVTTLLDHHAQILIFPIHNETRSKCEKKVKGELGVTSD